MSITQWYLNRYAVAHSIAFYNRSFTTDLFVFLNKFSNTASISIFSQCAATNQCLHSAIINTALFFILRMIIFLEILLLCMLDGKYYYIEDFK